MFIPLSLKIAYQHGRKLVLRYYCLLLLIIVIIYYLTCSWIRWSQGEDVILRGRYNSVSTLPAIVVPAPVMDVSICAIRKPKIGCDVVPTVLSKQKQVLSFLVDWLTLSASKTSRRSSRGNSGSRKTTGVPSNMAAALSPKPDTCVKGPQQKKTSSSAKYFGILQKTIEKRTLSKVVSENVHIVGKRFINSHFDTS